MAVDIDKGKIEKQAKEILDKFAKALEKVEKEHEIGSFVDREEFERKEKAGSSEKSDDSDFKQKMLKNAPQHDDDFIIAEKKEWS